MSWIKKILPLNKVALIYWSDVIEIQQIQKLLKLLGDLEHSTYIKGIILIINSSGGSASASEIIYNKIKSVSSKKTTYSYCPKALSGGYMMACGCDRIFAPNTGLIGGIGVISIRPVLEQFLANLGITFEVVKKGENKDMWSPLRPSTVEESNKLEALHDEIYALFCGIVGDSRKLDGELIKRVATGEIFTGSQAHKLGLINANLTFDQLLEEMSANVGIKRSWFIEYKVKPNVSTQIIGSLLNMAVNYKV